LGIRSLLSLLTPHEEIILLAPSSRVTLSMPTRLFRFQNSARRHLFPCGHTRAKGNPFISFLLGLTVKTKPLGSNPMLCLMAGDGSMVQTLVKTIGIALSKPSSAMFSSTSGRKQSGPCHFCSKVCEGVKALCLSLPPLHRSTLGDTDLYLATDL